MIQAPSMIKSDFLSIKIKHLPTANNVVFDGWVTAFADNYNSNWSSTTVYGRMDPLVTFQNTQRNISLSFDVVSANTAEAMNNLINVNTLIQFLYPVYEIEDQRNLRSNQNTLKAAPLIGLAWTNLISNANSGEYLVGYLGGVNYAPDVADGGFYVGKEQSKMIGQVGAGFEGTTTTQHPQSRLGDSTLAGPNTETVLAGGADLVTSQRMTQIDESITTQLYIPKKLNISLQFGVLHTHLPGWYNDGSGYTFGTSQKFPNANNITTKIITTSEFNVRVDDDGLPIMGSAPGVEDPVFLAAGPSLSTQTTTDPVTPVAITEADVASLLES